MTLRPDSGATARDLGLVLIGAALVLAGVTFGWSAAAAPDGGGVDGQNASQTLVGVQGGGQGLHEYGRVVLTDGRGGTTLIHGDTDSYFDVTQLPDGRVLAGFMDGGYDDCGPYDAPCTRTGFRILDPEAGSVAFEHSFPVRSRRNSEAHDVERLPSGNFVFTDMDHERIAIVDREGTVQWQWNASSFYDSPPDPTRSDWLHINDVDRIGDGRFLVSIRNANQLVVVERGSGVVEVVNADDGTAPESECTQFGRLADADGDGDVRCGDPDLIDAQHNPQWLGDGAVLVADSGNDRVVELHRTASGEWEVAWALSSANGVDFTWPRDADRLPGGTTLVTDSANGRVVEVTSDGETVWSATIDDCHYPYEAERLPEGETVGGPRYENGTVVEPGDGVPVLTPALSILRTSGLVPHCLSDLHLGVGAVSLVLAITGTASLASAWRASD